MVDIILAGLRRAARNADQLNELDARLGDGDLGATIKSCAHSVSEIEGASYPSIAEALVACAERLSNVSGSSFATVCAIALRGAAEASGDRTVVAASDAPLLLQGAIDAVLDLGHVAPGDKTMIDGLIAIRSGIAALGLESAEATDLTRAAAKSLDGEMSRLRGESFRAGRARIYRDRGRGLDDPGMVALRFALGDSVPETS